MEEKNNLADHCFRGSCLVYEGTTEIYDGQKF